MPQLDLREPAVWQNLHAALAAVREKSPMARQPEGRGWLVLRYHDIVSLLRDPRLGPQGIEMLEDQGIVDGPLHRAWQRILFVSNAPAHSRLRALIARAFTPKTLEGVRPRVGEIVDDLIDRVEGRRQLDLVADFAHHIPLRVIADLLAVPNDDYERFAAWTSDLGLAFSSELSPEAQRIAEDSLTGLSAFVRDLIEARRSEPGSDLLSALIEAEEAGERLTAEELLAIVIYLLFAGHDTTKSLLSSACASLLRTRPQDRQPVRLLMENPELWPTAVEETLRYEGPVLMVARVAREAMTICDIEIAAGEKIWLCLLSANRDARRFDEPDRFVVTRRDTRHLAFGLGPHFCIGATLARAQAEEALRVLFSRCPHLALSIARPRWLPFEVPRRLEALPAIF